MHLNFRRDLLLSFVITGNPEDGSNGLNGLIFGLNIGLDWELPYIKIQSTKLLLFFFCKQCCAISELLTGPGQGGWPLSRFGSLTNCMHLARIKAPDLGKMKNPLERTQELQARECPR